MVQHAAVQITAGRVLIDGDLTVQLEVVPGATHLFEEPGALELVSQLALGWCRRHMKGALN